MEDGALPKITKVFLIPQYYKKTIENVLCMKIGNPESRLHLLLFNDLFKLCMGYRIQ
jgi:hypothetical protein